MSLKLRIYDRVSFLVRQSRHRGQRVSRLMGVVESLGALKAGLLALRLRRLWAVGGPATYLVEAGTEPRR